MSEVAVVLPAGACDCHTHVVGDVAYYPMVSERFYTPALAPHEALVHHMQRNHLQRIVIVQPSFYGTDNRCMVDSLMRLQGAGRGIAVVDERLDDAGLEQLHQVGVRGLRINVESSGVRDAKAVEAPLQNWAKRIAHLGWHLQIYATHHTLIDMAPVLDALSVPVVLDHFGMVPADTPHDDKQLHALLDLMAGGNVYVKLSAPYRIAQTACVAAATDLAQTFVHLYPQRVLWGSDWPHTNREPGKTAHEVSAYRCIPSATLSESIQSWFPTASLREQVLVTNPERLYDF